MHSQETHYPPSNAVMQEAELGREASALQSVDLQESPVCGTLSGEKMKMAQKRPPAQVAPQYQAQWQSCTCCFFFLIGGTISSCIPVAGLRIGSFLVEQMVPFELPCVGSNLTNGTLSAPHPPLTPT